jgi:phosphoglycerol transferase MdoB-like AlkP superfamily enzyme
MYGRVHKILRELLDPRDWAYLLALLIPLVLYNLVLKGAGVAAQDEEVGGVFEAVSLIRSDLLFNAGYAAFWIGLFSVARSGVPRGVVLALFHAVSLLVVAISTTAYQYFQATGSTLDYSVVVFYLGTLGEIKDIIASEAPWYVWIVLASALLYVLFGPWLVTRTIARRAGRRDPAASAGLPRLNALGLCLISIGLVSFSLVPGTADANQAFSLSPPVNVLVTGVRSPTADELTTEEASRLAVSLKDARLAPTPGTEKRNVVLIHLESVRERSTDPYSPGVGTTPFLDDLADHSLLVERAYTTIPHTSKALTSLNCGIYPHPETDIHEAEPDGIPVRCLPELLREQGYRSMMFQAATGKFEDRPQLAENFGYDGFIGLEEMDKTGFERAGYLGYEDDIMLEPSREWLEENGDKGPFLTSYITITAHHEWLAPDRYGLRDYGVEDERLNRYLNTVRYEDFFVRNLIRQYKDLGLYQNTIFIIYGDHGEGFAEHGVRGHDNVIHEEGLRVPLIIHDPQRWQDGARISSDYPANHMDIPPTILDLLNYRVESADYPGSSVVGVPDRRTLYFNCRPDLLCMASTKGYEKYIYHYGKQPEEFYDLRKDPLERNNLAPGMSEEELKRRQEELIEWRARSAALFDDAEDEKSE